MSTADEDAPSQSEGKDTVKSSTDSYAVPQEKEAKSRRQGELTERMASPSSAEAARTLLDLPEEAPTTSVPAGPTPSAPPTASKVVGNAVEENGVDSQDKVMVLKETVVATVAGMDEEVVDAVPSSLPKRSSSLGESGANGRADGGLARLSSGDHKPPLPATCTSSRRDSEQPMNAAQVNTQVVEDGQGPVEESHQPGEAGKLPDVRQLDQDLDLAQSLFTGNESLQGLTGSSRSEGLATGAKRRKGGVPRRVPQEQDGVQTSVEESKKESVQGVDKDGAISAGGEALEEDLGTASVKTKMKEQNECQSTPQVTEMTGNNTPASPFGNKNAGANTIPSITQILKAISYNNSVTQDKQDVLVLFKASRYVFKTLMSKVLSCQRSSLNSETLGCHNLSARNSF